MDKKIRRNESCVIGLPRCDFVFSSARTCFVGYGFSQSTLEMNILRNILEKQNIQIEEAGGSIAPAQNAYCAKICSKIITSQFCIVLLNNEEKDGEEIPNANVNMEYGLMLGFNKYVIPFQKKAQTLPFNVAGLDTIKYTASDFERLAIKAIDQAVEETKQDTSSADVDQKLGLFLLSQKTLVCRVASEGDRNIYDMGRPLGFDLLHDFSGFNYIFLGNFTSLRSEVILWRMRMLNDIVTERRDSFPKRVEVGILPPEKVSFALKLLNDLQIWIITTRDTDKNIILESIDKNPLNYKVNIFSLNDIDSGLEEFL